MTTIKKLVINAEQIELSDDDILDITRNKTNLMTYASLENYNNIDDVLGEHGACVLLYQHDESEGHWCCIFKSAQNDDTLIFHDPYGIKLDSEIEKSPFQMRRHNGEIVPHLSHLLEKSNYKVIQDTYQFQEFKHDINTCGKFVCVRLLFRDYTPRKYKHLLLNSFEGMNPDKTVSMLTLLFSHPE